jgi:hypothetical protein
MGAEIQEISDFNSLFWDIVIEDLYEVCLERKIKNSETRQMFRALTLLLIKGF